MALEYRTADGHTVTIDQVKQVFGFRDTSVGKVADVLLTGAILPVSLLLDTHPADVAYDLEAATEAEQVAAEVASDNQWLTSERDDSYSIPLSDIERHNAKVKKDIFTHDPNCKHEKAFPTYGGMMCRHCGTKFEARNDFEQRLVNARNPKGNGYVNWQFR